jgi:hypothetical protein
MYTKFKSDLEMKPTFSKHNAQGADVRGIGNTSGIGENQRNPVQYELKGRLLG